MQADSLSAESQGKPFHKVMAAINGDSSEGAGKDHLKPSGKDSPFWMPLKTFVIHGKRSKISTGDWNKGFRTLHKLS